MPKLQNVLLIFADFFTSCQGRQEDAQEFLSCILNGMHEEMLQLSQMISGPVKGICRVYPLFKAQLVHISPCV